MTHVAIDFEWANIGKMTAILGVQFEWHRKSVDRHGHIEHSTKVEGIQVGGGGHQQPSWMP